LGRVGKTDSVDNGGDDQEVEEEPWANVFHSIQESYGWTDEMIMNLTLDRILQISRAIGRQKIKNLKLDLKVKEVEVRTICRFIACTAYPSKKGENIKRLLKEVEKIKFSMDDEKPKEPELGSYEQLQQVFGR